MPPDPDAAFELVPLRGGVLGIRSLRYNEVCHPGVGPEEEARRVYVEGLELRRLLKASSEGLVVWDVGLGGGANATAAIRAAIECQAPLRVISFDHSLAPLEFAVRHADALGYFRELAEAAAAVARNGRAEFSIQGARITWETVVADFPKWLRDATRTGASEVPAPDCILFDPHSPARNPEMWTVPLFTDLRARVGAERPCRLATYTRSTAVRVALLVSGFHVGAGTGTHSKEETTLASTDLAVLKRPLDLRWLERARRSHAAEPWTAPPHIQRPLRPETLHRLREHPQFKP